MTRHAKSAVASWRQKVLAALEESSAPMTTDEVRTEVGVTNYSSAYQMVYNALASLAKDGKVMRCPIQGHSSMYWELAERTVAGVPRQVDEMDGAEEVLDALSPVPDRDRYTTEALMVKARGRAMADLRDGHREEYERRVRMHHRRLMCDPLAPRLTQRTRSNAGEGRLEEGA